MCTGDQGLAQASCRCRLGLRWEVVGARGCFFVEAVNGRGKLGARSWQQNRSVADLCPERCQRFDIGAVVGGNALPYSWLREQLASNRIIIVRTLAGPELSRP